MTSARTAPFDSIEAAQEYLALLSGTVVENKDNIAKEIQRQRHENSTRYIEVLELVAFNLERLENHLRTSAKILSNLRKLRALLLDGKPGARDCPAAAVIDSRSPANVRPEEHENQTDVVEVSG